MLALGGPYPTDASANTSAMVTVRTYNYARLSVAHLSDARATTDAIFRSADISLQWIDCRVPHSDGPSCTEPLQAGRDLMLRLMDRPQSPASAARVLTLGRSMLDREQRTGALMTIDLFPLRAIAEGTPTDFPTLLGRAIAHEIGHLLLGSSVHPRQGLMRALWLHDELRGTRPAHWRFSPREAAQMRHGLATKAAAAN